MLCRISQALLEKALSKRADGAGRDEADDAAGSEPGSGKKNREKAPSRERDGSARRQRPTRPADASHTPEDAPRVKPSLLEPTKAFEAQRMPARRREEEVVDEEERVHQEEEKYEKAAQLRRKFKEQHKQILLNMLIKKRESDKKKEEEERLEAHRALVKKMKRDERLARRAAESGSREPEPEPAPADPAPAARKPRRRPEPAPAPAAAPAFVTGSAPDDGDGGSFGATTAATGGGPPLRRSRSQGVSKEELNGGPRGEEPAKQPRRRRAQEEGEASGGTEGRRAKSAVAATESPAGGEPKPARMRRVRSRTDVEAPGAAQRSPGGADQPGDADLKRNLEALDEMTGDAVSKKKEKRAAALSAKEKIDAQLAAIASQRRQAEEEERKKEERMRRRVEKLARRIVQEAHEGKRDPSAEGAEAAAAAAEGAERARRPKKVTPEMAEAMVARLQAKAQKTADGIAMLSAASVPARDFADWKRKHNVPSDGQVFSMTGWYPCVKEALLKRGWVFNSDPLSPYFDLKWTLRSSDIGLETLQPWQLTNHFLKNIAITTKAGLIKSLQQLVWQADVPPDDIIPRAYDLTNVSDLHAFVADFRLQKAEGMLKGVYAKITGDGARLTRPSRPRTAGPQVSDGSDDSKDGASPSEQPSASPSARDGPRPFTARVLYETAVPLPACNGKSPDEVLVNKAVFEACCSALERFLRPEDDTYIDTREEDDDDIPMTPLEWELITGHDLYSATRAGLPDTPPELLGPFGRDIAGDDSAADDPAKAQKYQAAQHRNRRRQRKTESALRAKADAAVTELVPVGQQGFQRVHDILYRLQALAANQAGLNGSGEESKNIWIVKPAAKSRGRGICTFVDLDKLLQYCDVAQKGQGSGSGGASMWIVQKYMENPLVIQSRKFDLRQWVLVTDWNPLTIYFFDEAYCRFSSEEYSTSEESLDNSFVHLVNQSVNKNNLDKKGLVFKAENGEEVHGFMWGCEQFKKYLAFRNDGRDVWTERVQPRMKEIAKMTLACAVDMIEHRKNSWELYGFDFMIDDEFNAWLIEVNSSPACDYSTPTTERYVQKALVELLSVTLDVRKWEAAPRKERGERPDTGGWECIYKGPMLETPASSFGTDMSVKGAGIKVPRRGPPAAGVGTISFNANGLERAGSVSFEDNASFEQLPKGPVGSKAAIVRRQSSGVENAPNATRRPRREAAASNSNSDDGDGSDGEAAAAAASKPVTKPAKATKSAYDPSALTRNSSFEGGRAGGPSAKHAAAEFDDSSGDEAGPAARGPRRHGAAGSAKATEPPPGAVAVPVKVFTVDF